MVYLKLFSRRIIKDSDIIEKINTMDSDKEILSYLKELGYEPDDIKGEFEDYYGIRYLDLNSLEIDKSIFLNFDIEKLRDKNILPYGIDDNKYLFVTSNIIKEEDIGTIKSSTSMENLDFNFAFAFDYEIENKFLDLLGSLESDIEESKQDTIYEADYDEIFKVKQWVNNILNKGINYGASDIHIESRPGGIQVRYRIDGILSRKEFHVLTEHEISNVIVRFKLISGMDISEKRKSQDGRIADYLLDDRDYDFRASCINTNMGEKIVLRIFNRSDRILSFEELGFNEEDIVKIKRALNNTNGVIYVVGATGSGKTTTLYSMIDQLNYDGVNIYTIEDPIEREIENVNQIQIDPIAGITFPSTLKSLLRQDPDIIVVGEVRDKETAELSISASLTGHLVISTLHANSAIDSISRLYEMGIESFLLGTSSLLFMSQKLVRKLCPHCKEKIDELDNIDKIWLEKKLGEEYTSNFTKFHDIYKPVGCSKCTDGFKGRIAVGEFFEVTNDVRELISQRKSAREIEELAFTQGFKTLDVAGIEKVVSGETSISELIRQLG